MNVQVPCPNCGTVFTVRNELIGKRSKCPKCATVFTLTAPAGNVSASNAPPEPLASIIPHAHSTSGSSAAAPAINFAPASSPSRADPPIGEISSIERQPSRPRFSALRAVAKAYEIMAIIVLVVAAVLLVMLVVAVATKPSAFVAALLTSGVTIFWAAVAAVTLLFAAQMIRLWLQVEQNTYDTRVACRRLANHLCSVESDE
jgi:predicted Zn finger-like uncharacterized protein